MKKNILIEVENHSINLITNGAKEYDKIVLCFHGFNGDKWGDAYSGLKNRLSNSLIASFDSCGHGESMISSENMRLEIILKEIDAVVKYFNNLEPNKPLLFVAVSYGAYRVMQYLIKYRPNVKKVIYVNPAFRILRIIELLKDFKYSELKDNQLIAMKRSQNKFMKKPFLDDLFNYDLFSKVFDITYDSLIVVGSHDNLIPVEDTMEIAKKYNYPIVYIDDEHNFKNKENWNIIVDLIKESK